MGIIIIFSSILVISIIGYLITCHLLELDEFTVLFGVVMAISIILNTTVFLMWGISSLDNLERYKILKQEYVYYTCILDNLETNNNNVSNIDTKKLYDDIQDYNTQVNNNKKHSNSKWNSIFYSKDIANLPVIKFEMKLNGLDNSTNSTSTKGE